MIKFSILLTIFYCLAAASVSNNSLRLRIDGASVWYFSETGTYHSGLYLCESFETRLDSLLQIKNPATCNTQRSVHFSGALGAELGDPLLNSYIGNTTFNRDHYSESYLSVATGKMLLYGGYRYIDTYSDRFDSIWGTYAIPMVKTELGLAEESIAGIAGKIGKSQMGASINNYGYWGVTPLHFSPLLSEGIRSSGFILAQVSDYRISTQAQLDKRGQYYDHHRKSEFDHISGELIIDADQRILSPDLSLSYDNNRLLPLSVGVLDTLSVDALRPNYAVRADKNGLTAGIGIDYITSSTLSFTFAFERTRFNPERPFFYRERDTVIFVNYSDQAGSLASLTARLLTKDSIFIATMGLAGKGLSFIDNSTSGDTIVLTSKKVRPGVTALVNGSCNVRFKTLKITGQMRGIKKLTSAPVQLYTPLAVSFAGAAIHPENSALSITARLNGYSYSVFSRYEDSVLKKFYSQPHLNADFIFSIPFMPPLLGKNVFPVAHIEITSLQLHGNYRQKEHPMGNYFGPQLAFRLDVVGRSDHNSNR